MVQCLIHLDENEKAEARLKETIQDFPEFVTARLMLGEILQKKGKTFDARREWERVIQIEPTNRKAKSLLDSNNQLNPNL